MDSPLADLTHLVQRARKRGAWGVEVSYERSEGTRMASRRSRVAEEEHVVASWVTVRCWLEGGRGAEARGAPEEADVLVDRALEAAAGADPDPYAGPEDRLEPALGGLGIDDRRHAALTREHRAEVLVAAERSVRQSDRRLSARDFVYEDRRRLRAFANSRGVALEEFDTTYTLHGAVVGNAAGEELRLAHRVEARTFSTIASLPLGTLLAQRGGALLQRAEPLEGEPLVVLPPHVVARIFARLAEGFAGPDDAFFLSPRSDAVLDPRIHLVDDGGLHGGLRTASFDDRGCAPLTVPLIRAGRPERRYLDLRRARALDLRPTGHWWGDALRPANLVLRSGTRSIHASLADRATWALWLDDLGEEAVDLRTGEVDAVVNGVVLHGNEPRGALRHARIRGNLLRVFEEVDEVASDTDRHGYVDAPGLLVRGFVLTPGSDRRSASR